MQCPKCHAPMHTYNRNGVQIEQCSGCRGIFLDYGELEALTRLEAQWGQQAPPAPPAPQAYPAAPAPHAPAWGAPHHGGHHGHHRGFGRMLFSS
ncbi:zf-TFIIB domain-containing protein [Streptomyces lavendofoliae]|uniref:TFIIB-type zinc ribbon-containing protein n=1 Tax=Streptomyces lavendofoliae TaxID=67314 RepID=UPI003D923F55